MNKALIDTDILSKIGKAKDATVAANAKTYRRSFGHYTFSTVSALTARGYPAPRPIASDQVPGRRDQEPIVRPSRPWLGYSLRRRP